MSRPPLILFFIHHNPHTSSPTASLTSRPTAARHAPHLLPRSSSIHHSNIAAHSHVHTPGRRCHGPWKRSGKKEEASSKGKFCWLLGSTLRVAYISSFLAAESRHSS
ncbi:hypothetical protein LR48_Vigan334s000100 [Vigna angularis]|uniref:Uncharacterized protein n=1 Tax=Phaseolus angularis TaxID=3914 RepID=A0A0L9T9W7_PHAAN|nr:hypothetical protein LR48_Vigan334s000100 [Vigna angularis]